MPPTRPIRTRLSRLLYERGWSDGELAQRVGLSRSRANLIKNRRTMPTTREALLIAHALDVRVEQVFALAEPSTAQRTGDHQ